MSRQKKSTDLVSVLITIEKKDLALLDSLKGTQGRGAYIAEAIKNPNIAQIMELKLKLAELESNTKPILKTIPGEPQRTPEEWYNRLYQNFQNMSYCVDSISYKNYEYYGKFLGKTVDELKDWLVAEKQKRNPDKAKQPIATL